MSDRTAVTDTIRNRALILLRRGLVTPIEAATLAGVSRQLVNFWLRREDIDHAGARAAWLRQLWTGRP